MRSITPPLAPQSSVTASPSAAVAQWVPPSQRQESPSSPDGRLRLAAAAESPGDAPGACRLRAQRLDAQ